MKKQNIVVGVAPTKRGFLSMEEAKRQKEKFMAVIRGIHPDVVTLWILMTYAKTEYCSKRKK